MCPEWRFLIMQLRVTVKDQLCEIDGGTQGMIDQLLGFHASRCAGDSATS